MTKESHHKGDKWEGIKEKSSHVANSIKEKSAEVVDNIQKHPTVRDVSAAAKRNPKEAILGTLIGLGFIFSFFWLGSFVVGLSAALFVPYTIKDLWQRALRFYEEEGKFASFMLAVAVLFLLVHTFWFVIGLAIGLAVKVLLPKKEVEPK